MRSPRLPEANATATRGYIVPKVKDEGPAGWCINSKVIGAFDRSSYSRPLTAASASTMLDRARNTCPRRRTCCRPPLPSSSLDRFPFDFLRWSLAASDTLKRNFSVLIFLYKRSFSFRAFQCSLLIGRRTHGGESNGSRRPLLRNPDPRV